MIQPKRKIPRIVDDTFTPPRKGIKNKHAPKKNATGDYRFDNGLVAFGNVVEHVASAEQRKQSKLPRKKRSSTARAENHDFNRKHG